MRRSRLLVALLVACARRPRRLWRRFGDESSPERPALGHDCRIGGRRRHGRLADVRPRRAAHPLHRRRPGPAVSHALGVLRQAADRVPAGARRTASSSSSTRPARCTSSTPRPARRIRQVEPRQRRHQSRLRRRRHLPRPDERHADRARGTERPKTEVDASRPPSELESSPLVVDGRVYIGSDDGTFYALDADLRQGRLDRRKLGHRGQGEPELRRRAPSTSATTRGPSGRSTPTSGKRAGAPTPPSLPPGGDGGFYSSPSVAFGNVYEARTDGTVYALDASDRQARLAVSRPRTRSTAHRRPPRYPGTPPTVYVGSYDHQLYALDAASGKKRWVYNVGGVVPGHADRGRHHRLHLELSEQEDVRRRREDRQEGVRVGLGRLHPGDLRRRAGLPDRLPDGLGVRRETGRRRTAAPAPAGIIARRGQRSPRPRSREPGGTRSAMSPRPHSSSGQSEVSTASSALVGERLAKRARGLELAEVARRCPSRRRRRRRRQLGEPVGVKRALARCPAPCAIRSLKPIAGRPLCA